MKVEPVGSLSAAGARFDVFDFGEGPTIDSRAVLSDGEFAWSPPRTGRVWLVQRGDSVFIVNAGSFEDAVSADNVLAYAESLVPTIEFVDFAGPGD